MDRHACRPDLRFALAAAGARGSLCLRGLEGEVCERLRGCLEQGDEPRSLRPCLISGEGLRGFLEANQVIRPAFQNDHALITARARLGRWNHTPSWPPPDLIRGCPGHPRLGYSTEGDG